MRTVIRAYETTKVAVQEVLGIKVTKKWESQVKAEDAIYDLKPEDNPLILVVMGATGAGKSTYINGLLGTRRFDMEVGHSLGSCTKTLSYKTLTISETPLADHEGFLQLGHRKVVLVDTPGFDDNSVTDTEILERIGIWLARSFTAGTKITGLVYLQNMGDNRIRGMGEKQISTMQALVGKNALHRVLIAFTQWKHLAPRTRNNRRKEMESVYFKGMLNRGARMEQVADSTPSEGAEASDVSRNLDLEATRAKHWEQLSPLLLEALCEPNPILNIQDELVKLNRKITRTDAHAALLRPPRAQKVENKAATVTVGRDAA